MSNKMRKSTFESLISSPWAKPPENSYYGDPSHIDKEQHGLEHIDLDQLDDEDVERVVILGYN